MAAKNVTAGRKPHTYTEADNIYIEKAWRAGIPTQQIADKLHVMPSAIYKQVNRLRLEKRKPVPANKWSEEEDRNLIALFNKGLSTEEIAARIGRTRSGVAYKISTMGLHREKNPERYVHTEVETVQQKRNKEATRELIERHKRWVKEGKLKRFITPKIY